MRYEKKNKFVPILHVNINVKLRTEEPLNCLEIMAKPQRKPQRYTFTFVPKNS